MTPKEKAKQLVDKLIQPTMTLVEDYEWVDDIDSAKQCALILVDEFIQYLRWTQDYHLANYWREIKQEIELL